MVKKVCIATGTRAEYGLLKPIIEKVHQAQDLELQLLVTGMHLSEEFGLTYREIERDGYPIAKKIEMLLYPDTAKGVVQSMSTELMGLADFFEEKKPDIIVILGDRYEMLMVAASAMIFGVPIAHIHGGELTEGAFDDAIRHSITKMSHLHFTATKEYQNRVIQLGEQPENVFCVGALGVENVKKIPLMKKEELESSIGFTFSPKTIMITYHPVTLENMTSEKQFRNLLNVIAKNKDLRVIFTKANSDTDGRVINRMIDEFVENHSDRCVAFASLGQRRYLSALKYADAAVGNSSSGLIEVPSFHIPTVNIGDRQKGRMCAKSVLHCGNEESEIQAALEKALSKEFLEEIKDVRNPYEGKNTSDLIVETIRDRIMVGIERKKTFYNIDV